LLFNLDTSSTRATDEEIGKRFEELSGRKAISMQKTNVRTKLKFISLKKNFKIKIL
jgi:hypothetical protein